MNKNQEAETMRNNVTTKFACCECACDMKSYGIVVASR